MYGWKGNILEGGVASRSNDILDKDSAWLPLAKALKDAEDQITKDLVDCQGSSVDIGGYYHPNPALAEAAMRPSKKFNELMDNMESAL